MSRDTTLGAERRRPHQGILKPPSSTKAGLRPRLRPCLQPAFVDDPTGHHNCRWTGQDNCRCPA